MNTLSGFNDADYNVIIRCRLVYNSIRSGLRIRPYQGAQLFFPCVLIYENLHELSRNILWHSILSLVIWCTLSTIRNILSHYYFNSRKPIREIANLVFCLFSFHHNILEYFCTLKQSLKCTNCSLGCVKTK